MLVCRQNSMIADPKSEKTLARIASALETSFVFKGIEQNVLQQVNLLIPCDKGQCTSHIVKTSSFMQSAPGYSSTSSNIIPNLSHSCSRGYNLFDYGKILRNVALSAMHQHTSDLERIPRSVCNLPIGFEPCLCLQDWYTLLDNMHVFVLADL